MSENYDFIAIFPICDHFGATRMLNSRRMVYKTYIFINSNLSSFKNWKQNWNINNTAFTLWLWVKVLFLQKIADFFQENAGISKIKKALVLKGIFSETTYVCVLTCQIWSF